MNPNFATTRWSLVQSAATEADLRRQALAELYQLYWHPICNYLKRMDVAEADVEDLAQEFFLDFFKSPTMHRANPKVGRFRTYLLGALHHHVLKFRRKASAQKRGGGRTPISLEVVALQSATPDPDLARDFDREWAQTMVSHSMTRLEREALEQGLEPELTNRLVHGDSNLTQQQIASHLGITVVALKTRVFRLRRRFREILREEVSRTVIDESETDNELAYLSQILQSHFS